MGSILVPFISGNEVHWTGCMKGKWKISAQNTSEAFSSWLVIVNGFAFGN